MNTNIIHVATSNYSNAIKVVKKICARRKLTYKYVGESNNAHTFKLISLV
jgi:hypothetical protein